MTGPKPPDLSGTGLPDGTIVEPLYDSASGRASFAVRYPDGQIQKVDRLAAGDSKTTPGIDSLVKSGCVLLPSDVGSYPSDEALRGQVSDFIRSYVDLPCQTLHGVGVDWAMVATGYVLLSWVYDVFTVLPYLRFLGDTDTGKTRALLTLGAVCYKPIFAGGAITPAPVFRAIEKHRGTLVVDELDFRYSDGWVDIVKILNVGYHDGFPVLRADGEGFEVRAYRVFGPKLLATRRRFADDALESRCLSVHMRSTRRRDLPLALPASFYEEAQAIRNNLLAFRLTNLSTLKPRSAHVMSGLAPRFAQVLSPLMAVMPEHEALLALAHQQMQDVAMDRAGTLDARVASVLAERYRDGQDPPRISAVREEVRKLLIAEKALNREIGQVTHKKVGAIIRNLGFETGRATTGNRPYEVKSWDKGALEEMAVRFGLDAPGDGEPDVDAP